LLLAGVLCVLILVIAALNSGNGPQDSSNAPSKPGDGVAVLISKCGKPDVDDSTQFDKPRPPIVTRWLVYKKYHVKTLFVARGNFGEAPPYSGWNLIGITDSRTNKPLPPSLWDRRLPCATASSPK
ncbi:MAG: hypothetical protein ACREP9_18625, partial [Candidatus Dormibacteraceae bacterium]